MNVLGVSAFYHDSAVALLQKGQLTFAAQEERFTRLKHDASFPSHAIVAALEQKQISLTDIDAIVFYEKPFLKMERLVETYLNFAPKGLSSFRKAFPLWSKQKIFQKRDIEKYLKKIDPNYQAEKSPIYFCEHHLSHGASAYYPSPFDEALVLTLDGVGEWASTAVHIAQGPELKKYKEIHFPHSLGLFYSAITSFCGFKVNSGEYKLMGLAPYGKPQFKQKILDHMLISRQDGSFVLNPEYFNYCVGLTMFSDSMEDFFGCSARAPEQKLAEIYMDIAASAQEALEDVVLKMLTQLKAELGFKNLCLAGGVALNCVMNRKIEKSGLFEKIWVQPAAGDAGGALGAAYYYWYQKTRHDKPKVSQASMGGADLGPSFSDEEIKKTLIEQGLQFYELNMEDLIHKVVELLANGESGGWFQGAMEYGPRALGQRSILADPRDQGMQKRLNLKIKNRESFRPFAPAVLKEHVHEWFESSGDPYMLFTTELKAEHWKKGDSLVRGVEQLEQMESHLPAVTHVDGSARLQVVSEENSPLFYQLLKAFHAKTQVPVLVNTSFNVRGEPIVCTPKDAINCFMGTDLDWLAMGSFLLIKNEQKKEKILHNFSEQFQPD